jgi:uncharacterized protein with PQ loop repeat
MNLLLLKYFDCNSLPIYSSEQLNTASVVFAVYGILIINNLKSLLDIHYDPMLKVDSVELL